MRARSFLLLVTGGCLGWICHGTAVADAPDPAETLRRVTDDVVNRYPTPPTRDALTYAAIHGMTTLLDRWSRFYAPSEVATLTADPADMGIGAATTSAECGLLVASVGEPARGAGLRVGDCIVAVDGVKLAGLAAGDRASRLLGSARTASVLEVQRGGLGSVVPVRRDFRGGAPLQIVPVAAQPSVVWLHVASFPAGMTALWPVATAKDAGRPVVVDLRGDPGGELQEAVTFVDRFATEGFVVRSTVRGETPVEYSAKNDGDEVTGRVVVLVDEGTASAAEIAAAALRERVHARVVGRATVGKRAIETIIRYEDGSALQLSIGHFDVAGGALPVDVAVPVGASEEGWTRAALSALSAG